MSIINWFLVQSNRSMLTFPRIWLWLKGSVCAVYAWYTITWICAIIIALGTIFDDWYIKHNILYIFVAKIFSQKMLPITALFYVLAYSVIVLRPYYDYELVDQHICQKCMFVCSSAFNFNVNIVMTGQNPFFQNLKAASLNKCYSLLNLKENMWASTILCCRVAFQREKRPYRRRNHRHPAPGIVQGLRGTYSTVHAPGVNVLHSCYVGDDQASRNRSLAKVKLKIFYIWQHWNFELGNTNISTNSTLATPIFLWLNWTKFICPKLK